MEQTSREPTLINPFSRKLDSIKPRSVVKTGLVLIFSAGILLASCSGGLAAWAGSSAQSSSAQSKAGISRPDDASIERQMLNTPARQAVLGSETLEFDRLSLEEGLSQSVVHTILQDSLGFVWIGTQDGLNRFDGYEFQVYKQDPEDPSSISSNYILALAEGPGGDLWIGTSGGGLNRFDRETGEFIHYTDQQDSQKGLSENIVGEIFTDNHGVIWIGTDSSGLYRYEPQADEFTAFQYDSTRQDSLGGMHVSEIFQDEAGNLWIGLGDGGLNRFLPESGTFQRYPVDPEDPSALSGEHVTAIAQDDEGFIWIGTSGKGLNRLDPATDTFLHYKAIPGNPFALANANVTSLLNDSDGVLWVGTNGGGLQQYDPENRRFYTYKFNPDDPSSISSDSILSMYEDQAGILWFGTFGGGLNKFDPYRRKFDHVAYSPGGLNSSSVWDLVEDRNGILWIATGGGGLNRFDRTTGEWRYYLPNESEENSISYDTILGLLEGRDGTLWVGTYGGGLDAFDPKTEQFIQYDTPPLIMEIYEDQGGILWIGSNGGGLSRLNPESGKLKEYLHNSGDPYSISNDSVVKIIEDQNGDFWIGTFAGGLNHFEKDTERFFHYYHDPKNPLSLSSNTVLSIYEADNGVLWIATTGGLNKFDPEIEGFVHYREKDGLPSDFVYGILEDGRGDLWLSTNYGISKFDPRTEVFENFDERDGLQSTEFNQGAYYKNSRGEMFFGGINGFNIFDPTMVRKNDYVPPVVITDFQLFNESVSPSAESGLKKPISLAQNIDLSYQDDFFSFEFASLHFSDPEKNQYAYYLEGLDRDWNYVGDRRFASYTNVPPGDYMFRVRGTNSDGIWNEAGTALSITVAPPIWQTWWFRVLTGFLAVSLIIATYRWRIRSGELQRIRLKEQVNEKTKELRAAMLELKRSKDQAEAANQAKSLFLANMSHELRTPLNAILGFSQLMLKSDEPEGQLEGRLTPEQEDNLQVIVRSGEHLLGLINEVLEMSKIEAGQMTVKEHDFDLRRMLEGLEEMFGLRAQQKDLFLIFEIDDAVPQYVHADEGKLRQILLNLLGNAIKFTQTGGVVLSASMLDLDPSSDPNSKEPTTKRLRFEVRDSGPGIEPKDLETIFDPFVQASTASDAQEGTGLGLTISLQFANVMGGDLSAESEPGVGSVFYLELPIKILDKVSDHAEAPARRVVGLQSGQSEYRVLVVDDKEVNRKLLVKMLAPVGFKVREATHGREALTIWDAWNPQVILMDMRMPVMDGYEATRQIRSSTKGQATCIIALTASALEEDREFILSEGCDAYIRKPFQERELFETIEKHVGVKYLYQPEPSAALETPGFEISKKENDFYKNLAKYPPSLLENLEHATVIGDMEMILSIIKTIEDDEPEMARELKALTQEYNHDRILAIIENLRA
jgi:two-component system sensor histidine kinase ChiS